MEKFKTFLVEINVLTEEQYEELAKNINFSIKRDADKKIIISFDFESMPSPNLFFDLLAKTKNNDGVKFINLYDNCIFDFNVVSQYLIYFSEKNKIFSPTIKNVILRSSGKIENSILFINYLNFGEEKELTSALPTIKKFLESCGMKFKKIELIFDEKMREIEMYKDKKSKIDPSISTFQKKSFDSYNNSKIYKNTSIKGPLEKIIDIIPEQRNAVILVEIFDIKKIITKNSKIIYRLYATDFSSSMLLKYLPWGNANINKVISEIKVGNWIRAKIDLQIDQFEKNELVGIIKELTIEKNPHMAKNSDNSSKKRIEFLAHSNMSAFEGINKFETIGNKAIEFGHEAIGLTDKFNCQSFPAASSFQAKNKDKIKVLYGFQSNVLDKQIKAVLNPRNEDLKTGKYVIFDLETTGFFPYVDDIIEFGAIKYENRQIIDKIQFFIKPNQPIKAKITEITKITNEIVENAMDIVLALEKIRDFFQDNILIAHNGIAFDINFLNHKFEKHGMEVLTNPLIDTMVVSRSLNQTFKSHSLGSLCSKYKIEYSDLSSHRADFDAEVLLTVWTILLDKMIEKNITNLIDINKNIINESLIMKSRPWLANFHSLNKNGIKKIYELISQSLTINLLNYPFLWKDDFINNKDNLLFSNSPTQGDVIEAALFGTDADLILKITKYDIIFVAPPSCFKHEIKRNNISHEQLQQVMKRIYYAAISCNKKVLASSEMYYVNKEDKIVFDIYVHTKAVGGKRHRLYSYNGDNSEMPELYFKTTSEMLAEFQFLGEAIALEIVVDNPKEISDLFIDKITPISHNLQTPIIEGAAEKMSDLAWKNLHKIFGENPHQFLIERLKRELSAIIDHGYAVIYWFSHLLVKISNDDGFLVGSRGSIGSSFAATMINITDVNPLPPYYLCEKCKAFTFVKNVNSGFDLPMIKCQYCSFTMEGNGHNIPFEVFMGFDGDKVPDIDLNFSASYQAKAHNYIKNTFGAKHVFRAGTIGTVAEKTAFGYVKNYFEEIGKTDTSNAEINRLAKKCCDVKRTTGQHPGGIIVVPLEKDVHDFTPYNFPADDKDQNWYTTHYAFESLHDSLLKFDILGHDSPTVLKMLEETTKINPKVIPNNDDAVMEMFNNVESLGIKPENLFNSKVASFGIPEFGTRFVREMLEITKPKKFSDLVRISGLSHGTDVWNNNAKDLIAKSNIDISEVISCRDDIMIYLQDKGMDNLEAFKIMEDVRKGKGLLVEYVKSMKMAKVPDWYIDSCQKIKYLFPKAHATAYVDMAWKIAWYKKYYPLHFYASYLSIRISVFDVAAIFKGKEYIIRKYNEINNLYKNPQTKYTVKSKDLDLLTVYEILVEMFERGFKFKNVDLLKSKEKDFIIGDDFLIPPFSIISGLGEAASKSILIARNEKPFSSKQDLLSRTKINRTVLKIFEDNEIVANLPDSDQQKLF